MSKILVTGGAGFIGTNLCKKLTELGHEVTSIDNYSTGYKNNHIKGVKYIENNILNIENQKGNYDLCFHLSALARIQPSFKNPMDVFLNNSEGTARVLEFCRKKNIKMIYAGSSSKHHDPHQSPYATSKYIGEELCKMYRKTYGIHVDIARFYNVYGEHEITLGEYTAVIGKWRGLVAKNLPLTVVGDGKQRRDFTYVGDIVDGLIKISKLKDYNEDAWELGTGLNYSINKVAEKFKEVFDCEIIHVEDQKGNYRETLRENDEAINELEWKPKDYLMDYIESYKKKNEQENT